MEQNNSFDLKSVKVHRTLEGTIFEVITAIILVVMWAVAIATKFFDISSMHGDQMAIIIISVVSIILLLVAYSPQNINLGQEPKNIRQVEIAIRTTRILAVELALFCLLMVAISPDNPIIHAALGITVVSTAIVSSILIRKAK